MTDDPSVLAFRNVSKQFGSVIAVRALTESIAAGEYFCILGPSGCGKTTLLRMVAGFEDPNEGDIVLDGRTVNGIPPEKRDVNIVFQSYALFPHMNVFENVAFGLRARRMSAEAINARVNEALEMVRLGEYAQRLPRELSGGQQQRVALARALVMQPRVLLLDEPLSALDRHLRLAMQEELRRIHAETGLTFVHITHDQSEALALGDRVAVMRAGEFLQVDKPETLYRRPGHRFVAEFVGINNVFEAKVLSAGPAQLLVGEVVLRSNGRVAVAGDTAYLSIRPEALHVGNNPDAVNSFKARLTAVAFAGAAIEMILHTGTQQWIAHVAARSRASGFEVGSEIDLSVDPEDVVVIPRDA